jgi:hypothetical protein
MTTQTSQGVAGRLGYGLGQVVRLVWFSQNRTVRWVKRLALIALAVYSWVWLAHAFMAVLTVGLILLALVKGDFSILKDSRDKDINEDDGYRYGLFGYGHYLNGARTDSDEEQ